MTEKEKRQQRITRIICISIAIIVCIIYCFPSKNADHDYSILNSNDNNSSKSSLNSISKSKVLGIWYHVIKDEGQFGVNELIEEFRLDSNGSGTYNARVRQYVGDVLVKTRSGDGFSFSWELKDNQIYIDGAPEYTYKDGILYDSGGNAFTK